MNEQTLAEVTHTLIDAGALVTAYAPPRAAPRPLSYRARRERTAAWEALVICRRLYPFKIKDLAELRKKYPVAAK